MDDTMLYFSQLVRSGDNVNGTGGKMAVTKGAHVMLRERWGHAFSVSRVVVVNVRAVLNGR